MLLEHLLATVDFPLPESAVQAEVDYREHEIVHSLGHDDALFDRYLEAQGKTREEFTAELRESAEQSVRAQFILDAIADTTRCRSATPSSPSTSCARPRATTWPPQEFAKQIMQGGNLPALVADVRRNKALADVLEHAAITDASGNAVDLSALAAHGRRRPRRRRRGRRSTRTTTTQHRVRHAPSERCPIRDSSRRRAWLVSKCHHHQHARGRSVDVSRFDPQPIRAPRCAAAAAA